MAITACGSGMGVHQQESGTRMVEVRRSPSLRGMAGGAIVPQRTSMRIILSMAGETILRRRLEIDQRAGIDMASFAGYRGMFAG